MPGAPMSPFLADIFAAFAPGAQAAGYGPPASAPMVSGTPLPTLTPPPNASGFPSLADLPPMPASVPPPAPPSLAPAGPPVPPTPPGMSSAFEDPNSLTSHAPPPVSQGAPPPISVGAEPGTAPTPAGPPMPGPDPHAFDLTPVGGGSVAAHEQDLRGPSLIAAQDNRNAAVAGAVEQVADRNQDQSNYELQQALSQERTARIREAAYQQTIAEQEDEMLARQDDFDQTARGLARMGQIDRGRFYASRSTGQKIAAGAELMLAGFRNAPSMVMKRIEDDVKAQEFAYGATRDTVNAKQTAFSAAMAKYQNAFAARSMARVAGIDVLQAELAQVAAKNRGNETGNRAIEAMALLTNDRMNQIREGIKFVPAQAGGRYFVDPATGIVYNNKEAMAYRAKQVEYGQSDRTKTADIGGQILVQRDKAALENGPDASGLPGMTKEQRGKLAVEQHEMATTAKEFNEQVDALKEHPALHELSPVGPSLAKLGPRVAPKSYKVEQDLNEINTSIINAIGKVAKDAEGKPSQNMLKMYKERFEIKQGVDTAETARDKLDRARNVVNSLARQQGSTSSPRPGNYATPEEIGALEKSTSFRAPKK